ncbi:MAG: UPF0104 family protein [Calditrichaeota bacterium]|nr:MAG: UPF0104 family protein [Calditrichota bacterium]
MKAFLVNSLRALVSFGLLVYLIYIADIQKIYQTLSSADYTYFGLAVLLFLAALFLFTLRWQILLKQSGISPGYWHLLVFYLIGYFFNNFLPTTIGGDVSRAYNAARSNGDKMGSIGIVLFERILGVLATLTLGSLSLIWAAQYFYTSKLIIITVSLLAFVLFVLVNLLNEKLFRITSSILQRVTWFGIGEKIQQVLAVIHGFRNQKITILYGYLISIGCQLLLIMMNYVLALSLGLHEVTISYLFLVIPVTFVMGLFPSINGLGVRDTGYVLLIPRLGVTTAEALSLSFLNTLVPMAVSTIGGLLLIFYRHKEQVEPLKNLHD